MLIFIQALVGLNSFDIFSVFLLVLNECLLFTIISLMVLLFHPVAQTRQLLFVLSLFKEFKKIRHFCLAVADNNCTKQGQSVR
jgi:hypothetical protein